MVIASRDKIVLETTHLANMFRKKKRMEDGCNISFKIANLKTFWLSEESAQGRNEWRKTIKPK